MTKKMTNIDVQEVSLVEEPKSGKDKFLAVKGETLSEEVSVDELKNMEAKLVTESAVTEEPVEDITFANSEANIIAVNAYKSLLAQTKVVPKEIMEAAKLILSGANLGLPEVVEHGLATEVQNLIDIVPEEVPANISNAIAIIKEWLGTGAQLQDGYGEMPTEMAPPPARVVSVNKLVEEAEELLADLVEAGNIEYSDAVAGFIKALKDALPNGGLVCVAGIVPETKNISIVNIADVFSSPDATITALIQYIIDDASDKGQMGMMSEADKLRKEAEDEMTTFATNIVDIIASQQARTTVEEQIQNSLYSLGSKLQVLVEKACPVQHDPKAAIAAALSENLAPIMERLERIESAQHNPKLVMNRQPEAEPVRRSMRTSPNSIKPTKAGPMAIGDIIQQSATRRFGS